MAGRTIGTWGLGSSGKLAIYPERLGRGRGERMEVPPRIHEQFLDMFSRTPLFQEKARTMQPLKTELLLLVSKKKKKSKRSGAIQVSQKKLGFFFLQEQMFESVTCWVSW